MVKTGFTDEDVCNVDVANETNHLCRNSQLSEKTASEWKRSAVASV